MRGSSATAFRLRAETRSLTRASLALTNSFMDWAIFLAGGGVCARRASCSCCVWVFVGGGKARLEFEGGAHAGQHEGVAAVGFGEFARGLGEASGPTGIDLDEGQAGLGERPLAQAMIG